MYWFFKEIKRPLKQVSDSGRNMLETKMNQKEIIKMQEHIQYILEYIRVETKSIQEDDIKIWMGKEKEEYYIKLKYTCLEANKQVYEMGKKELKKCMEYLSWDYKIRTESEDHAEVVKLYVEE